jgi:hypothetical protein
MKRYITQLALVTLATGFSSTAVLGAEWKQLFNGKNLSDWKHVGPGYMSVEDGLIRTHGGMGLLYWAGGPVGDCILRVVYRMRDKNDNPECSFGFRLNQTIRGCP